VRVTVLFAANRLVGRLGGDDLASTGSPVTAVRASRYRSCIGHEGRLPSACGVSDVT